MKLFGYSVFLMVVAFPLFVYADGLSVLTPYVLEFVQKYPKLATVIFIMGWMRANNKIITSGVKKFVLWTKTKYDDTLLQKLEKKPWWPTVAYLIDWVTSIKIESANKTQLKVEAEKKAHS